MVLFIQEHLIAIICLVGIGDSWFPLLYIHEETCFSSTQISTGADFVMVKMIKSFTEDSASLQFSLFSSSYDIPVFPIKIFPGSRKGII